MVDVMGDLLPQCVHRWEFDFTAQAAQKMDFHFCVRREFQRVEVEEVGLDSERIGAEGWAVSDVCDGIKALFAYAGPGDVHPILRHQFVIAAQINCRNRILRAEAAPPPRGGENAEGVSEELSCPADVAMLN